MREQEKKNDEKGYFFRAGQCAALSSFRVGKMLFFIGKGYVFYNFTKGCQSIKESMRFNLLHWKGLLFDWIQ